MGFFDSLIEFIRNVENKVDKIKDSIEKIKNSGLYKSIFDDSVDPLFKDAENISKNFKIKIFSIKNVSIQYNGEKYSLKHTSDKKDAKYLYDDVEFLSEYHLRLTICKSDGSYCYKVATAKRDNLIISDCEYVEVDFFQGNSAVIAIDADGDEYAIDMFGNLKSLEGRV